MIEVGWSRRPGTAALTGRADTRASAFAAWTRARIGRGQLAPASPAELRRAGRGRHLDTRRARRLLARRRRVDWTEVLAREAPARAARRDRRARRTSPTLRPYAAWSAHWRPCGSVLMGAIRRRISARSSVAINIPPTMPQAGSRPRGRTVGKTAAQPIEIARGKGVAATSSTAARRSYGSSTAPAARPPSSTSSPRTSDNTVEGIAERAAPASPAATALPGTPPEQQRLTRAW